MRSNNPKYFFSKKEREAIQAAICESEVKTSGEIRVHIQCDTSSDVLMDAKQVFEKLGMTRTHEQNGVLILFEIKKRQFAIIGDKGIHEKVPPNFWEGIAQSMQKNFREDRFADGLVDGVKQIGEKLETYFSAQKHNPNELSDRISYGRV